MSRSSSSHRTAPVASSAGSGKVSEGEGRILEKTVSFGGYMMRIDNIATMSINKESNHWPMQLFVIAGALGVMSGLGLISKNETTKVMSFILLVSSFIFVLFAMMIERKYFLQIGTSDGRTLSIVSQNEAFLRQIQKAIAEKMDDSTNQNYVFNIENQEIHTSGGGLALGEGSTAGGRHF